MDPVYDAFFNAFKCMTVPMLVGVFCWVYFEKPFSLMIMALPPAVFSVVYITPVYKQKFLNIGVFLLTIAAMQFSIAVFSIHPYFLVIVLFILIYVSVSSIKYRYSSVFVAFLAVIYMTLPQSWVLGVNRLIELCCITLIIIFLMVLYEYLLSKFKLRFTILYFIELMWDAFKITTALDLKKDSKALRNKYLFERPMTVRADFEVEKIFDTDMEKFDHRIFIEMINKGKFIESEEFFFKKNKDYRNFIYPIYILIRRGIRSISYMLKFNIHKTEIYKLYPTTPILIKNIYDALSKIDSAIRENEKMSFSFNEDDIQNWNKECLHVSNLPNNIIDDGIIESIYGIKCLIGDIKKIEKIIFAKQIGM